MDQGNVSEIGGDCCVALKQWMPAHTCIYTQILTQKNNTNTHFTHTDIAVVGLQPNTMVDNCVYTYMCVCVHP